MSSNKSVGAEKAYDREIAESYDRDRVKEPIWNIEHEFMKNALKPFANSGAKVLDVPFGTGRFAPVYNEFNIAVLGVDISNAMLEQAQESYPELKAHWQLMVGSSTKLPVADQSVDIVVCCRLFHLLSPEDVEKSIFEFKRVARKQIIVHYFNLHKNSSIIARAKTAVRGMLSKEETPWDHIKNYEHYRRDALALFQKAGLKVNGETFLEDKTNKVTFFALSPAK